MGRLTTPENPEEGIGLALSGGGYRAMLFHLGSLWRLLEIGALQKVDRISSVSGGSITSAQLALSWSKIHSVNDFVKLVVNPVKALASKTIDRSSIIGGVLLPGDVADKVSGQYSKHLFGEKTLQDLPDSPRFVINATNVETGVLWRFSKPYMGDYAVGLVEKPTVTVADAVTASSAFPPVLSPYVLDIEPDAFTKPVAGVPAAMQRDITLTDGGVYDNLGLETVEKRYLTVLVSDAGAAIAREPTPPTDWARHAMRALDIIHSQAASQRKRGLVARLNAGEREGAYWGIGTAIADYELSDAIEAPLARTRELAETPTRLKKLPPLRQERLINWGYAVSDAAVRRHWMTSAPGPAGLPYPESGI